MIASCSYARRFFQLIVAHQNQSILRRYLKDLAYKLEQHRGKACYLFLRASKLNQRTLRQFDLSEALYLNRETNQREQYKPTSWIHS